MDTNRASFSGGIRSATEMDMDRILEIERLSFVDQWKYDHFKGALKELFFVYEEKEILGFLIACCCGMANRAIIMRVAVHPDHRGKGIATLLLKTALDKLKQRGIGEVEIDVDIGKTGAFKLYENCGFRQMRLVTMNYTLNSDNESFYMMKLTFNTADKH
jgi:ribosomal-protein-alanine N-acetyltransferase